MLRLYSTYIKTTRNNVVRNCIRAVKHNLDAWLAHSKYVSGGGAPHTSNIVEELVKTHREEMRREESRRRRVMGSYSSEMSILRTMINEFTSSFCIKLKLQLLLLLQQQFLMEILEESSMGTLLSS